MSADERIDQQARELAARHLAEMTTVEFRVLCDRISAGHGTADDMITYVLAELRDCLDSLPPSTEHNGRRQDPFHAGCCALRALSVMLRLRDRLKEGAK